MIAISAVWAICAPNVGPIELAEKSAWVTPKLLVERVAHLGAPRPAPASRSRSGRRCRPARARRPSGSWRRRSPAGRARRAPGRRRGALDRRLDPRARLEVDAELEPEPGDRQRAGHEDQARRREEPASSCRRSRSATSAPLALVAPMANARADQARARHRAEDRRGGQHGGEQRDDRADPEREREALDARRGEREQDERHADRHDVGVDDRAQGLRVAVGDGGRDRPPGARLLLYSLEDDDVRVGRDAQREDQARDARQRERDRDQLDQREQEDRVDDAARRPPRRRARGRRGAGTAASAPGRRRPRAGPGPAPAGRASRTPGLRDQLELDRQRADAQVLGQVLGLLQAAEAGDLGAGAAVDALRVLAEVDRGQRDDLVVERDREALAGRLRGPRRRPGRQDDLASRAGRSAW